MQGNTRGVLSATKTHTDCSRRDIGIAERYRREHGRGRGDGNGRATDVRRLLRLRPHPEIGWAQGLASWPSAKLVLTVGELATSAVRARAGCHPLLA